MPAKVLAPLGRPDSFLESGEGEVPQALPDQVLGRQDSHPAVIGDEAVRPGDHASDGYHDRRNPQPRPLAVVRRSVHDHAIGLLPPNLLPGHPDSAERMSAEGRGSQERPRLVQRGVMCNAAQQPTVIRPAAVQQQRHLRYSPLHGFTPKAPFHECFQRWHFNFNKWQRQAAGGGCFNDLYIHNVDHCCWMKNAWPVKARAVGGRHYRTSPQGEPYVDQNFDTYSVEYIFADDAKLLLSGRCVPNCYQNHGSVARGTRGGAIVARGDCFGPSATFQGLAAMSKSNQLWKSRVPPDEASPYQNEWNDLVDAIRDDKPYNEVRYDVEASVVANMGRIALARPSPRKLGSSYGRRTFGQHIGDISTFGFSRGEGFVAITCQDRGSRGIPGLLRMVELPRNKRPGRGDRHG